MAKGVLLHELRDALQQAIINSDRVSNIPQVEEWAALVQRVQDLDSVLYLPHKCHLAGCVPPTHYCGQGVGVEAIATAAVEDLKAADSNSFLIVKNAIQQALGNIDISDERRNITARLGAIGEVIARAKVDTPRPNIDLADLEWLWSVASRLLQLYAKEASNSFCRAHNQQHNYCATCLNTFMVRSLKAAAVAVKAVCTQEQIEAIATKAATETSFVTYLKNAEVAKDKPRDGGF